eukprot:m.97457 g.97457  ORF g.97457 m.97457 type:complete len:281 (+) comp26979_c0_seq1:203-1045(+)
MAVRLTSSLHRLLEPTIVLIHGLDSAKDTWTAVLQQLVAKNIPAVAYDLRGHGHSPLGDPNDFSVRALVDDVKKAAIETGILGHPNQKIVLVGHSMGGRVVIEYAATYPDDICCLLIEDIDLVSRKIKLDPNRVLGEFDRHFETWELCKQALVDSGYDGQRVDNYKGSRISETPKGGWWSAINPDAQYLACKHVLCTDHGVNAFKKLDSMMRPVEKFPIHLFVAGDKKATACNDVGQMTTLLPSMVVKTFEGRGHSIHNEATDEFCDLLVTMWKLAASKL